MIQRVQSIYLALVFLLSGGLIFFLKIGKTQGNSTTDILSLFHHESFILKSISISFWIVSALALVSIFLYRNRTLQITINRINILINLILLGLLAYYLLNLSGETTVSMKGIGSFLPLLSIALLILANYAIKKDENLVKSIDRLR